MVGKKAKRHATDGHVVHSLDAQSDLTTRACTARCRAPKLLVAVSSVTRLDNGAEPGATVGASIDVWQFGLVVSELFEWRAVGPNLPGTDRLHCL